MFGFIVILKKCFKLVIKDGNDSLNENKRNYLTKIDLSILKVGDMSFEIKPELFEASVIDYDDIKYKVTINTRKI